MMYFSLVYATGYIINEACLEARFSECGVLCWLLYSSCRWVDDVCIEDDSKILSEDAADDIYVLVEGEILLFQAYSHAGGRGSTKRVLIDVWLEFGVHVDSHEHELAFFTRPTFKPLGFRDDDSRPV